MKAFLFSSLWPSPHSDTSSEIDDSLWGMSFSATTNKRLSPRFLWVHPLDGGTEFEQIILFDAQPQAPRIRLFLLAFLLCFGLRLRLRVKRFYFINVWQHGTLFTTTNERMHPIFIGSCHPA